MKRDWNAYRAGLQERLAEAVRDRDALATDALARIEDCRCPECEFKASISATAAGIFDRRATRLSRLTRAAYNRTNRMQA